MCQTLPESKWYSWIRELCCGTALLESCMPPVPILEKPCGFAFHCCTEFTSWHMLSYRYRWETWTSYWDGYSMTQKASSPSRWRHRLVWVLVHPLWHWLFWSSSSYTGKKLWHCKFLYNIIQWMWPSIYTLGLNKVPVFFILCQILSPRCCWMCEACCIRWSQPALWLIQSPHLMGAPRDASSLQNTVWYPAKKIFSRNHFNTNCTLTATQQLARTIPGLGPLATILLLIAGGRANRLWGITRKFKSSWKI